jgi:predicted Zn-dependent protease
MMRRFCCGGIILLFGIWLHACNPSQLAKGLSAVPAGGSKQLQAVQKGAKLASAVTNTDSLKAVLAKRGVMSEAELNALERGAKAVKKAFTPFSPEQEYYIGRSVAATLLKQYRPWMNAEALAYLNTLGSALALFSDRPELFGGYHFMILDTEEINAFATPGGHVLVSRGLLGCCSTEDELAAVLAHEIGHIQNGDGLRAISKNRRTDMLLVLASEASGLSKKSNLKQLSSLLSGAVGDIVEKLVNMGYSRELEFHADESAASIMTRAGYDPHALVSMLRRMETRWKSDGLGFMKTHPSPGDRIAALGAVLQSVPAQKTTAARQARFDGFLGRLSG